MIRSAVLWGSVAPDLPLYGLGVVGAAYFHYALGWEIGPTMDHMWGTLFFEDPGWIALHNVLHAPIVLLALAAIARVMKASRARLSAWLHWFAMACLLHTTIDILTHHDDGPILFWPVNWSFRVYTPVSYWDPAHYGREFFIFELALDLVLIAYLIAPWLRARLRRSRPDPGGAA